MFHQGMSRTSTTFWMLRIQKLRGWERKSEYCLLTGRTKPRNLNHRYTIFLLSIKDLHNLVTNTLFPITLNWSIFTWDLLIFEQLEKHRRTDQELKKRVLKLEFCLQESQSQMRKLKRVCSFRFHKGISLILCYSWLSAYSPSGSIIVVISFAC